MHRALPGRQGSEMCPPVTQWLQSPNTESHRGDRGVCPYCLSGKYGQILKQQQQANQSRDSGQKCPLLDLSHLQLIQWFETHFQVALWNSLVVRVCRLSATT